MARKKTEKPRKKRYWSRNKPYWNDETLEKEVRVWIQEHGQFPNKRHGVHAARLLAHMKELGGVRRWREHFRLPLATRHPGYWSESTIEAKISQLIEKLGRYPRNAEMESGMVQAMDRFGGPGSFKARFGCQPRKSPGYFDDDTNVERELRLQIEHLGRFPTQRDLKRGKGLAGLRHAVSREGLLVWRRRLGYELDRVVPGYWDEVKNVELGLKEWIDPRGYFPREGDLVRASRNDLLGGIRKHGGLPFWRAKLGYGPITPECLREHADVLARVILALDVRDTAAFWAALQKRWAMKDLTEAIREYVEQGKLERFRELLTAAG